MFVQGSGNEGKKDILIRSVQKHFLVKASSYIQSCADFQSEKNYFTEITQSSERLYRPQVLKLNVLLLYDLAES